MSEVRQKLYYSDSELPQDLSGIPSSVYNIVAEGLRNRILLDILYEDSLGARVKRRVLPEVLYYWNDEWYLAVYCHLREEERTFRVDRIISAESTEEQEESHGIADSYRREGIPWLRIDPEWEFTEPTYHKLSDHDREQRALYLDLIRYAEGNRIDLMQQVLDAGVELQYEHEDLTTPLFAAAENGSLDALKFLISAGSDPTKKNGAKDSLLFRAAWCSQDEIVHYLIEKLHHDPNEKNIHGWNALTAAANNFNCKLMKYLIEHGADINTTDANGKNLLMYILETHGNPERMMKAFRLLVESGADLSFTDRNGCNVLFYAANKANLECLQYLLNQKGLSINAQDDDGNNLLLSALTYYDKKRSLSEFDYNYQEEEKSVIRYLCESGADVNCANKSGEVPLMMAREYIFDYLLEQGADPFARTLSGGTVAIRHHYDLRHLDLLAAAGVDLKARDNYGNDVFMNMSPKYENIRYLVEKYGFSVNDRNREETILHQAAYLLKVDTVQYLLERGADPKALNRDLQTPFEHFQMEYPFADEDIGTEWEIYRLLEEYDDENFAGIMTACRALNLEKLMSYPPEILSRCVNVALGWESRTALRIVEEEWTSPGRIKPEETVIKILDFLVESGANPVEDQDSDRHSLIVTCLEMKRKDLAEKYLDMWLNRQDDAQKSLSWLYEYYKKAKEQEKLSLILDVIEEKLKVI